MTRALSASNTLSRTKIPKKRKLKTKITKPIHVYLLSLSQEETRRKCLIIVIIIIVIHFSYQKKILSLSRFPLLSRRPTHITPLPRRHIAQIPLSSVLRIILQRRNIPTSLLILDTGRQSSKALSNTRSITQLLGRLTLAWVAEASVHVGGCGALKRVGSLLVHLLVVEVWVWSVGFVGWG